MRHQQGKGSAAEEDDVAVSSSQWNVTQMRFVQHTSKRLKRAMTMARSIPLCHMTERQIARLMRIPCADSKFDMLCSNGRTCTERSW
mmetsp:Transcript_19435/g.54060  ORF Transcript_19435/g.54060 Transcript_19435/m.54060 type:complete len:87 (-) Transcript_19435:635-895(-)